ncbi:ABC transporter ATP-binding protein [Sporolactobacillus kofuensis]|uniref:ABC transporter ATP-binding protein n=1 Tax=Sporolactobacillus kofuensis TaxID=269672 RepID=A0ABW1WFF1_9BACL|nr:ABC transporter ATP-binding protein [Sporolactobacillus kofuensis]MCO7174857.1 ABC transporter ATP-binding protein [Sporolactobacillus kofuensis]
MSESQPLLKVMNLNVQFHTNKKTIRAVNGLSFQLNKGEVIGIVGESGSGKSVTAASILKLIPTPPGEIASGEILYKGQDLVQYKEKDMRKIRGNEISMIFQDPMTSLNPTYTIGNQLIEAIRLHKKVSKKEAIKQAIALLEMVGIHEAEKRLKMYPHEFSGGMRQRVMIAIALACDPSLLIADEPTTALDVTVQSQIMKLMKQLQIKFNASIILITHDLGVVWEMCDRVIVMYAGQAMEEATVQELYENPYHPYTWGLYDSQISKRTDPNEALHVIPGSPPDLSQPLQGCPFAQRCPYAEEVCFKEKPAYVEKNKGHKVACHFQTKTRNLSRKERDQNG